MEGMVKVDDRPHVRRQHTAVGGLRFDRHFHPSYAELEVHPDGSLRPSDRQPLKRCYYEGIVQGTKESLVIFSSCRGETSKHFY
eukprot:1394441-Amorphochlora_amoeboformis.AAC.2